MVFSNLIFLYLFLPANILLYYITKRNAWRNAVLVVFSLFFYAWGEPVWFTLLIFSATIDYFHGRICEKYRGHWQAKAGLLSSLILNLGLLGIFKYSGMLVSTVNALTGLQLPVPQISLPIGISFYTFQTISYVIDVYRGQAKAQKSYWKFFMYVSLYPQLVAGPIVRYTDVAAEIEERSANKEDFAAGIARFCIGLSKKVLIANIAGDFASRYLDGDLSGLTTAGAWFGVLMYAIQIYFDFSGYSDMAIGLARLFGCHYVENFNYPYISRSATEFWRRWHISMGSFFRDYVYIPMGGNRRHQFVNLFVVWFLTGLWHGASWNFVLWGLYYGVLVILEKLFLGKLLAKLPRILQHLYLLFAVVLGWSLFYYTDLSRLGAFLPTLFGLAGAGLWDVQLEVVLVNNLYWLIFALVGCLPILPMCKKRWEGWEKPALVRRGFSAVQMLVSLALLAFCTAFLAGQSYNPFLYFRF